MNAQQAISAAMDISLRVVKSYVEDMTDEELLHRPGPGCNHLAWQLGHLVASEGDLLNSLVPGAAPELPAGFKEMHDKANIASNDPAHFRGTQEYLSLLDQVYEATVKALGTQSEADLDQPSPEHFRQMFPTTGHIWMLIATHPMMHAGQFVPVRRALGKPVVI